MNNEPVAWIKKKEIGYMEVTKKCGAKDYATNLGLVPEDDDIPLYTHPVKELDEDFDAICLENKRLQAEIEALKAGKIRAYDNGVEDGRKPNTNPVKELTDEEIKFIAYPFESMYTTYDKQTDTDTVHTRFDQLGFARAILRKAQEK